MAREKYCLTSQIVFTRMTFPQNEKINRNYPRKLRKNEAL